jgi:peptidyl-prolyl cis-trans isomerase C
MSCSLHDQIVPKGRGVSVNGVAIPRGLIAREIQYHPSRTPAEAWKAAARALGIRELLLQETRRLAV